MSFDNFKSLIDGLSESSKLELASYVISEMNPSTVLKLIDVLRSGENFVSIEVLTEADLLEMKAEDAIHVRNLMHVIREEKSNEPA